MKKALYIIVPLAIIIVLYLVFFGFKKPATSANTRIAEIDNQLMNQKLTSDQVQALLTEKAVLQG